MENQELHTQNEFYLADWLEGKLTNEELRKLVSEEDFLAYRKLRDGVEVYRDLEQPLDASFQQVLNKINLRKRRKVRKLSVLWAASAAATVVLFFSLYSVINGGSRAIQTAISEQTTIELPDGSEIVLNAHSDIRYQEKNWETNRTIYLNGEAFFKVKKGSDFTVTTENGTVQVLGTQFNINSNLDYFEITCFEGKVKVSPQTGSDHILTAGTAFRRINAHPEEEWEFTNNSPGWIDGESSFRSVPLRYVISVFEKQYDLKFNSEKIDDTLLFTGSFGHDDVNIALASVFNAMQIHYTPSLEGVIVLSPY